jgi:hypothetical protein
MNFVKDDNPPTIPEGNTSGQEQQYGEIIKNLDTFPTSNQEREDLLNLTGATQEQQNQRGNPAQNDER